MRQKRPSGRLEEWSFYDSKRVQECVERITEAGEDHVSMGVNPVEGGEGEWVGAARSTAKPSRGSGTGGGTDTARSGGEWGTTD